MLNENKIKGNGVSLRTLYKWLVIIAMIMSAILIVSTFRTVNRFNSLSGATDEYIELQLAADELMQASDYLTEMSRRFAVDGNREYMDAYFKEAFETARREDALSKMSKHKDSERAMLKLRAAMDASVSLMDTEYYAMRLVVDAKGIQDYPEQLVYVELDAQDEALSPEEKMTRARYVLTDNAYYDQKDKITNRMRESVDELINLTRSSQVALNERLVREYDFIRVIIVLQAVGIIVVIWLTASLGINPVLKAVERIKDDSPIPEIGANEFRYLARAYNKMYEVYKQSISRLNYKVSHDELTGIYNRAGYNLLLNSTDLKTTYLILIDADRFKSINDTFGHEVGDKILQKIADVLRNSFRSEDYVCRIGGDEFAVVMLHADKDLDHLIKAKIDKINSLLADTEDDLPLMSISAGVAHGRHAADTTELFEKADIALYETKHKGGSGYTFFTEGMDSGCPA